jgi:hypothetical protein
LRLHGRPGIRGQLGVRQAQGLEEVGVQALAGGRVEEVPPRHRIDEADDVGHRLAAHGLVLEPQFVQQRCGIEQGAEHGHRGPAPLGLSIAGHRSDSLPGPSAGGRRRGDLVLVERMHRWILEGPRSVARRGSGGS